MSCSAVPALPFRRTCLFVVLQPPMPTDCGACEGRLASREARIAIPCPTAPFIKCFGHAPLSPYIHKFGCNEVLLVFLELGILYRDVSMLFASTCAVLVTELPESAYLIFR